MTKQNNFAAALFAVACVLVLAAALNGCGSTDEPGQGYVPRYEIKLYAEGVLIGEWDAEKIIHQSRGYCRFRQYGTGGQVRVYGDSLTIERVE